MLGPNWDCTPQCDMKENRQAVRHALRRMGETSLRAPLSSQFRNRWLLFSEEGRKEGSKGLHGEIAMERKVRREGDRLDKRRRQIRRKNNFPLLPFYVSLPSAVRASLWIFEGLS